MIFLILLKLPISSSKGLKIKILKILGIRLHHTLGDAARPLDDPRPCSRSGHAPSTSANSIPNFQKYDQAEDENENTSRFPAIKLTFRDPVNISQFKIIQVIIFDLDFMIKNILHSRALCENMDDYMEIVK